MLDSGEKQEEHVPSKTNGHKCSEEFGQQKDEVPAHNPTSILRLCRPLGSCNYYWSPRRCSSKAPKLTLIARRALQPTAPRPCK